MAASTVEGGADDRLVGSYREGRRFILVRAETDAATPFVRLRRRLGRFGRAPCSNPHRNCRHNADAAVSRLGANTAKRLKLLARPKRSLGNASKHSDFARGPTYLTSAIARGLESYARFPETQGTCNRRSRSGLHWLIHLGPSSLSQLCVHCLQVRRLHDHLFADQIN